VQALEAVEGEGLIFVTDPEVGDGWPEVAEELGEAFQLTKEGLVRPAPVTFVIDAADLLGRNGPGPAMVATGLVSGARTAGLEQGPAGVAVNLVAITPETRPEAVAEWCRRLREPGGPQGVVVNLGHGHLGKTPP
jgi:hypothetical protein